MKYLPLLAIVALTGCQTNYTQLTVSDHRGARLATWIAEGWVHRNEQGYTITAVERVSRDVPPIVSRYPNGWKTYVVGTNIVVEPVDKPEWLVELDGE